MTERDHFFRTFMHSRAAKARREAVIIAIVGAWVIAAAIIAAYPAIERLAG